MRSTLRAVPATVPDPFLNHPLFCEPPRTPQNVLDRTFPEPVTESADDRSPMAQAIAWSSRIITVSLEMVLPGVAGYWLDQKLGTVMLFLVLGVILGMVSGLVHLIRMAGAANEGVSDGQSDQHGPDLPV